MDRSQTIQVLRHGHDEIVRLRAQVAALEPRAHAYDTIAILARQSVQPAPQGYGEDPAWRIKNLVDQLVDEGRTESGTVASPPTTGEGH